MERSKTLVKNMEINQRNFRKEHLAIRNAMLPGEVAEKSSAIVKRLLQSEWYKDTKEIFAYYPLGNEVDCHALFLQAWADGKRIALPRTKEENQMDFFYIDSLKQLEEGTFHVMEPVRGSEKADPLQQPVIVPGLVKRNQFIRNRVIGKFQSIDTSVCLIGHIVHTHVAFIVTVI